MGARVRLLGREISRRPARHYSAASARRSSHRVSVWRSTTRNAARKSFAAATHCATFSPPFLSRWIFDVEIIARYIVRWGRDAVAGSVYELPVMRWHDVTGSNVKSHDFLRALADLWKIRRAYRKRKA